MSRFAHAPLFAAVLRFSRRAIMGRHQVVADPARRREIHASAAREVQRLTRVS